MFFGLTVEKVVLLGAIAFFLIGPARAAGLARGLAVFTRRARTMVDGARVAVKEETGVDLAETVRRYDPRSYDPREIVKRTLMDE